MDRSVRIRSWSMPVTLEMSKRVPRKLLVVAVYRIPPGSEENESEWKDVRIRRTKLPVGVADLRIIFSMIQTIRYRSIPKKFIKIYDGSSERAKKWRSSHTLK